MLNAPSKIDNTQLDELDLIWIKMIPFGTLFNVLTVLLGGSIGCF